jgi:multicomponent K+:H+ antiporter subunit E
MKHRRWFTRPMLSAVLAASWLLLQHSVAPIHLLAAGAIGVVVPRLVHAFLPPPAPVRPGAALALLALVLWDIVVANVAVARLVLGPIARLRPAWLLIPLELRHPVGISVLASIITTTPGTVSCTVDEERHLIRVHALDCRDPQQMVAEIKSRYERRLLAIFEAPAPNPGGRQ